MAFHVSVHVSADVTPADATGTVTAGHRVDDVPIPVAVAVAVCPLGNFQVFQWCLLVWG